MAEDEEQTTLSIKQPNFLVPKEKEIDKVVLLPSELSYDELSPVQKVISVKRESPNFELAPLSFSVNKSFFNLEPDKFKFDSLDNPTNKFIEKRGLLQYVKENSETAESYLMSWTAHLELRFPAGKGFAPSKYSKDLWKETDRFARTAINFSQMESATFSNTSSSKSKLIIKLKPNMVVHRLAIDIVERNVVLLISQKDKEQAEQFLTVIQMEIAKANQQEKEWIKLEQERNIKKAKLKQQEVTKKTFLNKLKNLLNK